VPSEKVLLSCEDRKASLQHHCQLEFSLILQAFLDHHQRDGDVKFQQHHLSDFFSDNKMNLWRMFTWPNKRTFDGYLANTLSYGTYSCPNGEKYKGYFINGKKSSKDLSEANASDLSCRGLHLCPLLLAEIAE
jgi:hypothetical protein